MPIALPMYRLHADKPEVVETIASLFQDLTHHGAYYFDLFMYRAVLLPVHHSVLL